jgi:hypothetical protein
MWEGVTQGVLTKLMTRELKMINASLQTEMEILRQSLEECYEEIERLQKNSAGNLLSEEEALALKREAEERMFRKMNIASKLQRAASIGAQQKVLQKLSEEMNAENQRLKQEAEAKRNAELQAAGMSFDATLGGVTKERDYYKSKMNELLQLRETVKRNDAAAKAREEELMARIEEQDATIDKLRTALKKKEAAELTGNDKVMALPWMTYMPATEIEMAQALLTGQTTVALPPSAVLHVQSRPDDQRVKNYFVMDVPGGSLIQLPTVPNKRSSDGYTISVPHEATLHFPNNAEGSMEVPGGCSIILPSGLGQHEYTITMSPGCTVYPGMADELNFDGASLQLRVRFWWRDSQEILHLAEFSSAAVLGGGGGVGLRRARAK